MHGLQLLICQGCISRNHLPPGILHHLCATSRIPDPPTSEEKLGKRCPRCAILDGTWLPSAVAGKIAVVLDNGASKAKGHGVHGALLISAKCIAYLFALQP